MSTIKRREFLLYAAGIISALALPGCDLVEATEKKYVTNTFMPSLDLLECDYLIHRGTVVDGTNTHPYIADIAIKGDRIYKIAQSIQGTGCKIIDARGKIVAPGFIDLHTHTEDYMQQNGRAEMILLQGVTTQIGGNCGTSKLNLGDFLDSIKGIGINFGMLAGYRELRRNVLGNANRHANSDQMNKMLYLLEQNLQDGAFGLSAGLEYWLQSYAPTQEIIELCRLVAGYDCFFAIHVRNEGDRVLQAVEEMIEIAAQAEVAVQYSHLKAAHQRNWGKTAQILQQIQAAHTAGIDITADVYGYTFSSNDLYRPDYDSISDGDLELALQHPQVMIASDSGLRVNGNAIHPRAYGNYPRLLRKYCRELELIPLETMIHKMTGMPAQRLGLHERGLLMEGKIADISIFDPTQITDEATRTHTEIYSTGVSDVLVNGVHAVARGQVTDRRGGKVLRKTYNTDSSV